VAKFRARARTVDMLGRQQIAGAATAISELFKNAHDAYATRVEVDYYRTENLFVLRDNGNGMTLEDFQERWLTLGTESKMDGQSSPFKPLDEPERPVMGEKGIGRLAIARIGPQVLVMTRAKRKEEVHDLVISLVNWQFFELPGINLDEIEFPVEVIPNGVLPDSKVIKSLSDKLLMTAAAIGKRVGPLVVEGIEKTIRSFSANPKRLDVFFNSEETLQAGETPLSLLGEGCGTHFIIQPTDTILGEEIDQDRDSEEATFTKFLVGFANTMIPDAPPPPVRTRFRDWRYPETPSELIAGGAFMTSDDFKNADHHFSGVFDEYGQFTGQVKIYDDEPIAHTIPWRESQGSKTLCGPFRVNFAHLHGNASESRVPPDEHAKIYSKLNRFGGLYIYRDDIRVLPYGNSNYDWLNIETRRNKGQGYYFFAYRRIFGSVSISRAENPHLTEKAGREGFQENRAYRQFRAILENFLIQLAADFFRTTGAKYAVYSQQKEELERADAARRKREESIRDRRKEFYEDLTRFFNRLASDEARRELSVIMDDIRATLVSASNTQDIDQMSVALIDAEIYSDSLLADLRKRNTVVKPRDIPLSRAKKREWEAYVVERQNLENEVFLPAEKDIRNTVGRAAEAARANINQRRRLEAIVDEIAVATEKSIRQSVSDVQSLADSRLGEVRMIVKAALSETSDVINGVRVELQRIEIDKQDATELAELRSRLEDTVKSVGEHHKGVLENARQQLLELDFFGSLEDGPITPGEITAAVEEEVMALKEAADADAELVQLGMALAVVTHEFDAVIRSIRDQLQRLKGWANASPQLRPIYDRISTNFEHLDGYLALFTPLQRRLYRNPQKISGSEISKFLEDLFGERLKRHEVVLETTRSFSTYSVTGYPSTFFPIFVNLLDNAIYWLKDKKTPRVIKLDERDGAMLVSNNGPNIDPKDKEAIFDLRFSRKPAGRGMGLYISRGTLKKAGFSLKLVKEEGMAVCFAIAPERDADEKT